MGLKPTEEAMMGLKPREYAFADGEVAAAMGLDPDEEHGILMCEDDDDGRRVTLVGDADSTRMLRDATRRTASAAGWRYRRRSIPSIAMAGRRPGTRTVLAILTDGANAPAVASALPRLQAVSSRAQPVFALDYRKTPASVRDTADDISASLTRLSVAKLWLPLLVAVFGLALVTLGLLRVRRRPVA